LALKKEKHDPRCNKCGHHHFNFQKCLEQQPVKPVFKHPLEGGFRVSTGWGNNTARANASTVMFRMPPRPHLGSLTLPE
jgi:hypothetical protein